MPDEDKNSGGSLVLDFRKRLHHVKTTYGLHLKKPRQSQSYDFGSILGLVLHGNFKIVTYKIPMFGHSTLEISKTSM